MNRPQVDADGVIRDLAAVFDSFFNGFPEVEADQDPRKSVLFRGLGEAGIGTSNRQRIVTGAASRQGRATGAKTDCVCAEEPLQHLRGRATFDTVRGVVVGNRRSRH